MQNEASKESFLVVNDVKHWAIPMSVGGNKIQGGCPIEDPLFTKILPDFRLIFCPIWLIFANFCNVRRAAAPQPPVSYAYGNPSKRSFTPLAKILVVLKKILRNSLKSFSFKNLPQSLQGLIPRHTKNSKISQ